MVEQKQNKKFSGSEDSSTTFGNSRSHRPGPLAGPGPFVSPGGLTRGQRRQVDRRLRLLNRVSQLKAAGLSETRAARKVRVSVQSLWRWRSRRLVPNTHLCGRQSTFEKFRVPASVLRRVRALQVHGRRPAEAWRAVAEENICPPQLTAFLRSVRTVPASFLRATAKPRREVVILEVRVFRRAKQ